MSNQVFQKEKKAKSFKAEAQLSPSAKLHSFKNNILQPTTK